MLFVAPANDSDHFGLQFEHLRTISGGPLEMTFGGPLVELEFYEILLPGYKILA